jgi:pyruvate dehydrogenase E1 component alpha subunit
MTQLTHAAIVRQGRYTQLSLDGVDPKLVRRLHHFMVRLRVVEERIIAAYHPADEMRCPVHFCIGQEAVSAALNQLLRPDDYLLSHHRSHGYYLAKDAPLEALLAELYGKETGASGGKAGSQDISKHSHRFYAGAILAGAIGISTGVGLGIQLQGGDNIAACGFGEGATDEGIFWEAVNLAALHKLPVVFVCENNCYATFSPQWKRQLNDNLDQRVSAFGVQTSTVFGNDVVQVHQALEAAVQRARSGGGPTFVQAYTYRWNGHVGPESDDRQNYRPPEEVELWKQNCPIALLEQRMRETGQLDDDQRQALLARIHAEIDEAFAFAQQSPFPGRPHWHALNYCSESPLADALLAEPDSGRFDQDQVFTLPEPY